jgi:TolA-binding protein
VKKSALAAALLMLFGSGVPAPALAERAARAERRAGARAPVERTLGPSSAGEKPLDLVAPEDLEGKLFQGAEGDPRDPRTQERERALIAKLLREREQLVVERRNEAIGQLEKLIKSEPKDSPLMADALLRLGELRWEEARAKYLEELGAWQAAKESVRKPKPPDAQLDVPIGIYDRILEQHREFDRYDLVLYMKAYALAEAGRMGDALESYWRILKELPHSRFRPDAHMAVAEWHFSGENDYAAALAQYQNVLAYPNSELSDLALFKSAWCLWKLGRTTEAAKRFREVLDLSGKLATLDNERRKRLLELQDEALQYLIQVFTEDERNSAADLHKFLKEIGGDRYALQMLRRLSRAFFDQSRFDRAVEAYAMLLQQEPDSPQAPQYQTQIAAAYAAVDDAPKTIEALDQLAARYAPGTVWAQRQADPQLPARAVTAAERAVRAQALHYHARAQREKQGTDFEHAATLYRVHTARFPDSVFAYEVSFYLAEILYHRMQQLDEAGKMYLRAAKLRPKGELTQDALYNAVLAFERARSAELAQCAKQGAQSPTCAETDTDRRFTEAIGMYIELFPSDPEVPGILFRQGKLYFDRGLYDPAVRQLGQLLERYPRSADAGAAGELVLESFNRAQDFANIETWARKLKGAPAFQNAEAQKKLDALILQAVFKNGEQLAGKKQHAEAAQAYLRAAHEFPRDARAPQAYVNAGQQWQLAGKLDAAAEAYDALIAAHPGSNEGALGAYAAAQMFETIAQFADAARYYEVYAEKFPRGDKRADALYNAIVLRVAAGDHARATEDAQLFLQAFPKHEARDAALLLLGRSYEAQEKWDAAADTYRRYAREGKSFDRRVEADTRLATVLLKKGDVRGAERALASASQAGGKNGARLNEGKYFAAQARFMQGDRVLAEMDAIKIEGEPRTLGKRLEKKAELLRKASSLYLEVVELRVAEWVTAALFKIGRSYELFAEGLRSAPVPSGLSEEEEQSYRDQLGSFIVPIEEKALEAYESGYQKALELEVLNKWTEELRSGLTRLNEVQYPPLRELGVESVSDPPLAQPPMLLGLRRSVATPAATASAALTGKKVKAKKRAQR